MNLAVNLNKNLHNTSHDAVTATKKIFKVRKAGHAGTLDPLATGVLIVCLNEATKITGYLADLDKEYIMTAKLGETTDTYDAEGPAVRRVGKVNVGLSEIEEALARFTGEIQQVPPMYSAIKREGKPLYELARQGIEVERKPRKVTISSISILKFESPFLTVRVACSKGTYIRSLCHDMGEALGVGAYVTELTRTRIGHFSIENAATLEELPFKTEAIYSLDAALQHLPSVRVEGDDLKRAKNGNPVKLSGGRQEIHKGFVRLADAGGRLFGIGKTFGGLIKIERLFNM
jgi:tRNA pseudouridine55 synthase